MRVFHQNLATEEDAHADPTASLLNVRKRRKRATTNAERATLVRPAYSK
jgi:hypothetical protein